jgi:hypothetical protein
MLGFSIQLLSFPENHGEQGHADEDAVSHLSEIGGPRIVIHVWMDLIHTWKGMENRDLFAKILRKAASMM